MRRGGKGPGTDAELTDQFAVSDQARWIKTSLENDSLTAISECRLNEVNMLAIVADHQLLINAIQQLGCLVFEDKKRVARERMVHWAMKLLPLYFGYFRTQYGKALHLQCAKAPEIREAVMQLIDGLKNMYSRPGSLHPESIVVARWLLPHIDEDCFAARIPNGAK